MMIHEKLMSGQFLLDLKNNRADILHAAHHQSHLNNHHTQLPSPPLPTTINMDLYSAYAYHQQLQQHLMATGSNHVPHPSTFSTPTEVLDLSRRCDSVETPRKTPSPYQTNSSFSTGSPTASPNNSQLQAQQHTVAQPAAVVPTNLLYSAAATQPYVAEAESGLPLSNALASFYPTLCYPGNLKTEIDAVSPIAPKPQIEPASKQQSPPLPVSTTNNLLQNFASAAVVGASVPMKVDATEVPCSPSTTPSNSVVPKSKYYATTPTSSSNSLSSLEAKNTRPFKAFPRDPLVIAANFAATDVLLDNPRVERYTEYRKRVLEQIRHSQGGARCITNPKMRRTHSRSGSINEAVGGGCSSNNNSESEERTAAEAESSDCDSNAGNFEKMTSSTGSTTSPTSNNNNNSSAATANIDSLSNNTFGGPQIKDAAYFERRRKNNAAAKKSRDRRRIKEDEIAIRAAYLERQNIELLCQIDALKAQLAVFTSKVGA